MSARSAEQEVERLRRVQLGMIAVLVLLFVLFTYQHFFPRDLFAPSVHTPLLILSDSGDRIACTLTSTEGGLKVVFHPRSKEETPRSLVLRMDVDGQILVNEHPIITGVTSGRTP